MTTNQKIRLNMYLAVRNYVLLNEAAATKIPKFEPCFADLQKNIAEIQLISEIQGVDKTGIAIGKNKLKWNLIAVAVKNANKAAILAKLSNNDTLLNEVSCTESDLLRLPGVTLKEQSQIIYERIEANLAALADQGITANTQKQFLEAINAFNNALSSPRTGITERKKATQKLRVLFADTDAILEIMDLAAGSAKDELTDFFNGYKATRKLVETNGGNVSLKARATDIATGSPLKGVIFTFTHEISGVHLTGSNGQIVKKTAAKGSFQIRNMVAGTYKVLVHKTGYNDKDLVVSIADGERSDLYVELEK